MHIETITHNGRKYAVVPIKELKKLMLDAEMLADIQAYDSAKARLEAGEDEIIPFALIERRLAGENPLKVWREYCDMTQEKLAVASKVSRAMIAAIESGHKKGSVITLKKLAVALGVSLDQLAG